MRGSAWLLVVSSACVIFGGCRSSNFSSSTTVAGDSADWSMHGRSYDEQRFSPLKQINAKNVGKLGLVWRYEFGTNRGLEATPLGVNGVIYTTADWSVGYAMDARTGQVLWTFDPQVPRSRARMICCDVVNRGVALYNGKVYVGT